MKLENNNINISISKQMMEVVENVFTLTTSVLAQTAEFFILKKHPMPSYKKVCSGIQ